MLIIHDAAHGYEVITHAAITGRAVENFIRDHRHGSLRAIIDQLGAVKRAPMNGDLA